MAKGRERLLGGIYLAKGDDLSSLVTIRNKNSDKSSQSETRIRWAMNPNLTKLVEVKEYDTPRNKY